MSVCQDDLLILLRSLQHWRRSGYPDSKLASLEQLESNYNNCLRETGHRPSRSSTAYFRTLYTEMLSNMSMMDKLAWISSYRHSK